MATVAPQNSVGTDKNIRMPVPRLERLIIKNFRDIGSESLVIDCQYIAKLAGYQNIENNSISRTYDVVMHHDCIQPPLTLEDFHKGLVDQQNLPEIELHSILPAKCIDSQWLNEIKEDQYLFKEKWTWEKPSVSPVHMALNTDINEWDIFKTSKPGKLNPIDNKDIKLSLLAIIDRALSMQSYIKNEPFENQKLVEKLKKIQDNVIKEYNNKFDV